MVTKAEVDNLEVRNPEDERDPNSRIMIYVGVIGIVLLVVTVFGTQAFTYGVQVQQTRRDVYGVPLPVLADVIKEQKLQIGETRWVDRDKGVVAIPIDQAMKLFVADVKAGKPRSSPLPAATPATQPAAPGANP